MNGLSFEQLTHNEAVAQLRQADRAVMTLHVCANPDVYAVFKQRMTLLANQLCEDKQVCVVGPPLLNRPARP